MRLSELLPNGIERPREILRVLEEGHDEVRRALNVPSIVDLVLQPVLRDDLTRQRRHRTMAESAFSYSVAGSHGAETLHARSLEQPPGYARCELALIHVVILAALEDSRVRANVDLIGVDAEDLVPDELGTPGRYIDLSSRDGARSTPKPGADLAIEEQVPLSEVLEEALEESWAGDSGSYAHLPLTRYTP